MSEDIERWEARIVEIDVALVPLQQERAALKRQIVEARSKFKAGDIIAWKHGRKGVRNGLVVAVERWVADEPCWKVQIIRADGTLSPVVRTLYPYHDPVLGFMA